jgi:Ca2+-binding RTX toxin-like protein
VTGGTGNDTVLAQDGNDVVEGDAGDDRMWGNAGSDSLRGGDGNDLQSGADGDDELWGGNGNDALYGGSGANDFRGGPGNDQEYGGPNFDAFIEDHALTPGVADSDQFVSGGGAYDSVSYRGHRLPVTADADGVTGDDGQDGERDTIDAGIDSIEGGSGNDHLYARDSGFALIGGPGNDTLVGGDGNDGLEGGAGNDHLEGRGGDDQLDGDGPHSEGTPPAMGADVILGGDGRDKVSYTQYDRGVTVDLDGEAGDDGAPGEGDTVGDDVEDLVGTSYTDQLTGNAAANDLQGNEGDDVIRGLGGNDILAGVKGKAKIYGGDGDDHLYGSLQSGVPVLLDGGANTTVGDSCYIGDPDETIDCEHLYR